MNDRERILSRQLQEPGDRQILVPFERQADRFPSLRAIQGIFQSKGQGLKIRWLKAGGGKIAMDLSRQNSQASRIIVQGADFTGKKRHEVSFFSRRFSFLPIKLAKRFGVQI